MKIDKVVEDVLVGVIVVKVEDETKENKGMVIVEANQID